MAYSKVILNGTTLMDVTQKTVTSGDMLSGTTALKNDGTDITGNIASKSSSDLTASGATVTAPAGYYASNATKSVASGTAGTPTASKGAVSNHSIAVTPSVTNTTGFITGDTKTGTAVTVSASELVSGTLSITSNDTYDVTNYASASVLVPSTAPNIQSLSITSNGTYTASGGVDGYSPITVNVSGGGGGGSYPWYGANTVLDYTKTITINLSEDTSWDSWTASTTATSILAAPTTNDFSYTFDKTQYVATVVTQTVTDYVYKSTATKTSIPISCGRFDVHYCIGTPTNYTNFYSGTITAVTIKSINDYRLSYYNSSGVESFASQQYGVYLYGAPSISTTNSGNNATIDYKRSSIYARCSSANFATARKGDIDSENTNIVLTIEVYKTPIANHCMHVEFDRMCQAMLASPEA